MAAQQQVTTEATIESLEAALQSNLRLQAELSRQLQRISEKKAENRRLASRLTKQILATWDEIDVLRTPPPPCAPRATKNSKKISTAESSKDSSIDSSAVKNPAKWKYDPYRKWTRRFFVDPSGSVPEPNQDSVKRRRLENDKLFYHTCPPWTSKEVETLLSVVGDLQATKEADGGGVDNLDFDEVARALEERSKGKLPTADPRTGQDCRLKYLDTRKQRPFTKEESLRILEQVHLHNGSPPWQNVAADIDRTAWQCLLAYESKLSRTRTSPWIASEDEMLLKYVAAMGPQWVLTMGSASDLTARLFPDRSPKQVMARANSSLVNPNLARDVWSDDEERKLVLGMKVYRDTPNPVYRAAVRALHANLSGLPDLFPAETNIPFHEFCHRPTFLIAQTRASPRSGSGL